ncbi:MAG: maleate cis-trans isomerase family protein [Pseudolabrys sp.]
MQRNIKALIVVPENNTTMEPEIAALCPALAPLPVARVKRPARTLLLEDLPAYGEATLEAIAPFADQEFDLVIYGCTAAGFLGGPDGNAKMVEKLRACTNATVVSTAGAMIDALRGEEVSSAAIVTPYLAPVNDGLRNYLQSCGIGVETLNSFYCKTTAELGQITEQQVLDLALRTVTPRSEALFIACSQLPTLKTVAKLRAQLDIPVWSSIQATAWAGVTALTAQGLPVRLLDAAAA